MDTILMIAHQAHYRRRARGEEEDKNGVKSEIVCSTAILRISGYIRVEICSSML